MHVYESLFQTILSFMQPTHPNYHSLKVLIDSHCAPFDPIAEHHRVDSICHSETKQPEARAIYDEHFATRRRKESEQKQ